MKKNILILALILLLTVNFCYASDNSGFWVRPEFSSSDLDGLCDQGMSFLFKPNVTADWQCASFNDNDFNITIDRKSTRLNSSHTRIA